ARTGRRDSRDPPGGDAAALFHGTAEHRRRARLDHRVPDPDQFAADAAGDITQFPVGWAKVRSTRTSSLASTAQHRAHAFLLRSVRVGTARVNDFTSR